MATTIYVAFVDTQMTSIEAVFASVQLEESFPYQAEIPSDDPRYVTYYNEIASLFPQLADTLIHPGA